MTIPNRSAMNVACPKLSPLLTPCTCPFLIMFITSYPCNVLHAVSNEKKPIVLATWDIRSGKLRTRKPLFHEEAGKSNKEKNDIFSFSNRRKTGERRRARRRNLEMLILFSQLSLPHS
jgi:hypothetical protein